MRVALSPQVLAALDRHAAKVAARDDDFHIEQLLSRLAKRICAATITDFLVMNVDLMLAPQTSEGLKDPISTALPLINSSSNRK
jgi:hypothetical protein